MTPAGARLPNEILLDIFSYLDYETLKLSVARTCRRFHNIIVDYPFKTRHDDLARTLFRDSFKQLSGPDGENLFQVHPAIKHLCLRPARNGQRGFVTAEDIQRSPVGMWADVGFITKGNGFVPLVETSMANEHVSSPATDWMSYKLRWWHGETWKRAFEDGSQGWDSTLPLHLKGVTLLAFVKCIGRAIVAEFCEDHRIKESSQRRYYNVMFGEKGPDLPLFARGRRLFEDTAFRDNTQVPWASEPNEIGDKHLSASCLINGWCGAWDSDPFYCRCCYGHYSGEFRGWSPYEFKDYFDPEEEEKRRRTQEKEQAAVERIISAGEHEQPYSQWPYLAMMYDSRNEKRRGASEKYRKKKHRRERRC